GGPGGTGIAPSEQLEYMEAVRAAHRIGDRPRLQVPDRVEKELRQAARITPAERGRLPFGRRSGNLRGKLVDVLAGAQASGQFVGAFALPGDFVLGRILRYLQQDLADFVLDRRFSALRPALPAREPGVDAGLADIHLRIDLALAQAGAQELATQLLAKRVEAHALARDPGAQFLDVEPVVGREALHHPVELRVGHPDAPLFRHLQLDPLDDELF